MSLVARNAWGIILSNLIICLSVLFFGGNVYLLIFSYLLEIIIGILFISLIIYGARDCQGDLILAGSFFMATIGYILYNCIDLLPQILPFAFAEKIFETWAFWTIVVAVIGCQLFNFFQNFIRAFDRKLPAASYYVICFLMQSAVIIIVTGGILPLAKVIMDQKTTIYIFAGTKAIFEILLLLPAYTESWSHDTRYRFFQTSRHL